MNVFRQGGEFNVTNNKSNRTICLGPSGAPVSHVYRHGNYMLVLAATEKTQE